MAGLGAFLYLAASFARFPRHLGFIIQVGHACAIVETLSPFSTRRICSRDAKRKQESGNVIG